MSASEGQMSTRAITLDDYSHATAEPISSFAASVGFYYSIRLIFPLLAVRVLWLDPQDGVVASLALNFLILVIAIFRSFGTTSKISEPILRLPCLSWVLMFFGFSGASLLWTVSASHAAAIAFWCAMAADTGIVLLLIRDGDVEAAGSSLMRGYVMGACVVALVAWLLPAQSDLRLGDEELLGPNQIGWLCGFAFFLAQYLIRKKGSGWWAPALVLALTLFRSLSKTTIIAFIVAQGYILLRDHEMSRAKKMLLTVLAVLIVLSFSSLLTSYYTIYTNAGNQSETLTGRLGIWFYIFNEAIQKPWIGHGFHSVWKVIPPFGQFEARHAHNELLQQFYSYGVVGVVLLIGTYGSVWRQLRRFEDGSLKILFTGLLLAVIVRGFADTEVFDLSLPLWFIAMLGALIRQPYVGDEAKI